MEKFTQRIYNDFKQFNPLIRFVPVEDVKQEIRFAIIIARPEQVYMVAGRLINALTADFGFSRKKGKDNFEEFYSEAAFTDEERALLSAIDDLYRGEGKTAREIASELNCEYTPAFQKIMHQCFPKGLGLGGKRKGAGNNKHLSQ